jgi:hypothetical protein
VLATSRNIAGAAPGCPLIAWGGLGSTPCPAEGEIAAPGANEALCRVSLQTLDAAGYPCLRRGMVITVERPWQWSRPLESLLAVGIRKASSKISGHPARASHAMLYLGRGRCASQNREFQVVDLVDYRGCTLRFWDPQTMQDARNALVAEAMVHVGQSYGYLDIAAQYLRAATGNPAWLEALGDKKHYICSEAVCELVRQTVDRRYAEPGKCNRTPQEIEDWMAAAGWPCVALALV